MKPAFRGSIIVSRPVHPLSRHVVTVAIWALTLCSIYSWSERLRLGTEHGNPKKLQPAFTLPPNSTDTIGRLLGTPLPIVQTAEGAMRAKFLLAGVIADVSGKGVALIGIDGKAARPYLVGAELAPGVILHSVIQNQAMLAGSLDATVNAVLIMENTKLAEGGNMQNVLRPTVAGIAPKNANSIAPGALSEIPAGPPPRADSRYRLPVMPHH